MKFVSYVKAAFVTIGAMLNTLHEPRVGDTLESFINWHKPQSPEQLEFVMAQYDEMRRIESRLISRGELTAARMLRASYL